MKNTTRYRPAALWPYAVYKVFSFDTAFARPSHVRFAKQYLFDFFRSHWMFGFDLINEAVFPDDLK